MLRKSWVQWNEVQSIILLLRVEIISRVSQANKVCKKVLLRFQGFFCREIEGCIFACLERSRLGVTSPFDHPWFTGFMTWTLAGHHCLWLQWCHAHVRQGYRREKSLKINPKKQQQHCQKHSIWTNKGKMGVEEIQMESDLESRGEQQKSGTEGVVTWMRPKDEMRRWKEPARYQSMSRRTRCKSHKNVPIDL